MNTKPSIKFDDIEIEILASPTHLDLLKGGKNNEGRSFLEILKEVNFICIINHGCEN